MHVPLSCTVLASVGMRRAMSVPQPFSADPPSDFNETERFTFAPIEKDPQQERQPALTGFGSLQT